MYKRIGSFFNSLSYVALCAVAFALITFPVHKANAQTADTAPDTSIPPDSNEPTAADIEVGPDPVAAPALDGGSPDVSPLFLSNTPSSDATLPTADEEPAAAPRRPRLNRIASEAFVALDQEASAHPLFFLNILLGLLGMLLLLAYARSRRQRRSLRYIAQVRHRSHV